MFFARVLALFIETIIRLFYGLFLVVKWLFMPFAILFNMLVLFPIARFWVSMSSQPAFREIRSDELPDDVWRHLESICRRFKRYGFVAGKYLHSDNVVSGMHNYILTLVNRSGQMGMGAIYIRPQKAKDDVFDLCGCEFSCYLQGRYVDICNNEMTEGFLPMPERERLVLKGYDDESLFRIYRKFTEKNRCKISADVLDNLQNNPRVVLNQEMQAMYASYLERSLIYHVKDGERYSLTWKGAFLSSIQTLWPMSAWYNEKIERLSLDFLSKHGVDVEQAAWQELDQSIDVSDLFVTAVPGVGSVNETCLSLYGSQLLDHELVSIIFSLVLDTDEKLEVDNIDVKYESAEEFEGRDSLWWSSLTVNLSRDDGQARLIENEALMLPRDDAKEMGIGLHTPFDHDMGELIDPVTAIDRMTEILGKRLDDVGAYMLELTMSGENLAWCGSLYSGDIQYDVHIDARQANLLSLDEVHY